MDVLGAGHAAESSPAPVSATFISKKQSKPPQKFIDASLVLTNNSNSTLWVVLPHWCDKPLKLKSPVRFKKGFEPTWICADGFNTGTYEKVVEGSKGKTIRLTVLFVAEDEAFCLLRLPLHGRVEFERYQFMMSSKYVQSFRVWTAEEIKVNGNEPLEKWLPYETLSDLQTLVPANASSDNLNFDSKLFRTRTDFRKDAILKLDLKITGTWEIPFKNFK